MNQEIKSIDIYSENCVFESNFLPLISFKTEEQKNKAEEYILTKVGIFFDKIIKINIDVRQSQISYSKLITEKDFKVKSMKEYFYKYLFFDLGERKSDGKLDFSPKWGITFDKKCAPISVSWLSPRFRLGRSKPSFTPLDCEKYLGYKENLHYGTIDINKKAIFYYIYFSLQEILDVIKNNQE